MGTKCCTFVSFDKDSYCRITRNRTVAIIGDSISLDHFLSLSHLLGVPYALPKVMNRNALLKSHVCNDMSNSGVISNDIGDSVSDNANDGSNRNAGSNYSSITTTSTLLGKQDFCYLNSVQQDTNEYFPDVLVLNQGAHYHVSDNELIGHLNNTLLFSQLNDWQDRCRLNDK